MKSSIYTRDLFDCQTPYLRDWFYQFTHPWEMLLQIESFIRQAVQEGIEGFSLHQGRIPMGESVKIAESACIEGMAILGSGTVIRHGAYLRGNVIAGEGCVIGNSTELKNCVLLNHVQVPHYNYVGDSILGNYAHMGAGAILSNVKADRSLVVIHAQKEYPTNLKKIGGILGDGAEIGCGCVLNPGTVVGKNTSVYPLTVLRGVFPADCIVKSAKEVVKRK
ncbi:MAG: UDP-N-acetylglucosamine pyrophosphorylase [Clostridia bacterium]|nr:UDP-N-acetylglucosamine pyrophosphorylase [Clostridia bacterium]